MFSTGYWGVIDSDGRNVAVYGGPGSESLGMRPFDIARMRAGTCDGRIVWLPLDTRISEWITGAA